uniref:Uncharacterized protein n=1 Tax=uncultured prokaryote TaxID=198431 RepID=A0A0H5Q3X9_9ZZZZ|nr:hypothetical protein [uncultured prokaryote]
MKITVVLLSALLIGGLWNPANADDGNDGGSGTHGMSGCDGGTDPSPDGKFYIPGTTQECNPSDDDRKKLDQ